VRTRQKPGERHPASTKLTEMPSALASGNDSLASGTDAKSERLKYRPDIDGLRAVAVLSVLMCHIGMPHMAGGFVGVDVFFVISGYLISAIVFGEIAAKRFSVSGFYQRRIRRIFPALFGMLLVFSIFAFVYFFPLDFVNYSSSLLSATASASNFWFARHSGYFDAQLSNPLLHTWSLAVEEQFYIVFPIFLVLVRRFFPRRLVGAVVALFAASLIASVIAVHYDRNTAFYMPYTRAWELLLGTMLSLRLFPRMGSAGLRNGAAFAGAAMILYPVLSYNAGTPFPGLAALLPCVGAALIIGAGESGGSLVGTMLSWRVAVFIGLISYSLYLWHWPVIILVQRGLLLSKQTTVPDWFARLVPAYRYVSVFRYDQVVETVLSLILAVLSWRFIERPFRSGRLRMTGKPLFTLAGVVVGLFVVFCLTGIFTGGLKGRFPAESVRLEAYDDYRVMDKPMREGTCFITNIYTFEQYDRGLCLQPKQGERNYLLLGDSHAAMIWMALSQALPGTNVMQATTGGCKPFVHSAQLPDCVKMMDFIFNDFLPQHSVDELMLEADWQAKGLGGLTDTVQWAKQNHVPVMVIGPVPQYDAPLPELEAYAVAWHRPDLASHHLLGEPRELDAQMQALAENEWHVPYVSLYRAICPNGSCAEYADAAHTIPLMFDTNHLSTAGSVTVVDQLRDEGEVK
jgi:peptidoglycan/LPS O-acetylase OafA/YrhL